MAEKTIEVAFKCPLQACKGRPFQKKELPVGKGPSVSIAQLQEAFQQRAITCRYCRSRLLLTIPPDWDPSRPILSGHVRSWDNAPIVDARPWSEENSDAEAPTDR